MKTREQIYRQDVEQLLRDITTYHCIRGAQIKRVYAKKADKVEKILAYLIKQGRVFYDPKLDIYFDSPSMETDTDMLLALWVLADFADKAEYHSTDAYPTEIVFFANGETYEIIYAPEGNEALVSHAFNMRQDSGNGKKIVIIDNTEQVPDIHIENAVFCTVDSVSGSIQYYKKQ